MASANFFLRGIPPIAVFGRSLYVKAIIENQQYEEKQITATCLAGASSANDQWLSINWKEIESQVCRLQMRGKRESTFVGKALEIGHLAQRYSTLKSNCSTMI